LKYLKEPLKSFRVDCLADSVAAETYTGDENKMADFP
jgi:hypothetical protein